MKPFIILLVSFSLVLIVTWISYGNPNWIASGNWAMMIMLMFTASAHFKFPEGMAHMMPDFVPYKLFLVYFTGVLEIASGVLLLFPATRWAAAVFLILFFVAILPANVSAAMRNIDYIKNTTEGNGPRYLWFRVPLQLFFIVWLYFFGIAPHV